MAKQENFFCMAIGLLLIVLGVTSIVDSIHNKQKHYIPLQNKAKYLLSLDCTHQECVTDGQMIYDHPENISSKSINTPIYHFRYYFQAGDQTYDNNDLPVFSEGLGFNKGGMRYIPAGRWNSNGFTPEKIIYDPHNPSINLPLAYAKVLPEIPNPYDIFQGLFILAGGIMFTINLYRGKNLFRKNK
ncbi:hypothetical protein [Snodgrassella gandavensis]|uniref:hypothetical protein n=1 Tax=Snodgrassella gandavensis TaxID=2946698 RepID=UPI001EF4050F|nr:hypothetical protein [Snodgrassella gandavensis]